MTAVDRVLGNVRDEPWKSRVASARLSVIELDGWEAQKHRLRRTADDGWDVAVNLDRDTLLQDGDVLAWDAQALQALIVRVRPKQVLRIRLEPAAPETLAERAVKLGHVLGNQHWPALARGSDVFVPLVVDRRVMEAVLRSHTLAGVTFAFESGEGLAIPYVAPHEHHHPANS